MLIDHTLEMTFVVPVVDVTGILLKQQIKLDLNEFLILSLKTNKFQIVSVLIKTIHPLKTSFFVMINNTKQMLN